MVTWQRLDMTETQWDGLLQGAADASPFQCHAWGEYKRRAGWTPERWLAKDGNGKTLAVLQALLKPLPLGRWLAWAPGGPVTGFAACRAPQLREILDGWVEEARKHRRLVLARFRSHRRNEGPWAFAAAQACRRPLFKIDSGFTVQIDLARPMEELRAAMDSKHRYYVKQAEAAGLEWRAGNTDELADDFATLYATMSGAKGLGRRGFDADSLKELCASLGSRAFVLAGYEGGRPVTACLVMTAFGTAFYQAAASNAEGRRSSAAYALIPRLLSELKGRELSRLDFGGIAPSSGVAGVNHFKLGFGGEVVEYLGEWEWAESAAARAALNVFIGARWR